MIREPDLQILSEKTLHHTASPGLVSYCPSMDLLALVTSDQQVLVYRLNGQRVYGATQRSVNLRVEGIQWKPNGQLFATAWSDGSIRLVGTESGKIVHQFSTGEHVSGVTCMGWASNLCVKPSGYVDLQKNLEFLRRQLPDDDDCSDHQVYLNLPRDLALIDIEISLPKLSVLASGENAEDVFCSRSSLDTLFRPFDPKDTNAVDVMVVGTKDGSIHISIYDSFFIGSFKPPVIVENIPSYLVLHASRDNCSMHALLMKNPRTESLRFVPMDLRFISASSDYLPLLASRSTALQNLLRYVHQVRLLMVAEWKATWDLPARFLRNINETLGGKDHGDIIQALCHSVVTGHTFPSVKEWLVDGLSERGHKRWDKAVTTGLENLKRLLHESMLPALERCSVIVSRFSGIAKFQNSDDVIGQTNHQISAILDSVGCLHLISSKILMQAVEEIDLFASFSAWLRYEIDRLASEASTSSADDNTEKEASIDHGKVLHYLQTVMTSSPLAVYFAESSSQEEIDILDDGNGRLPTVEILDKQLQKNERGLPFIKRMPRIEYLCNILTRQASELFSQIAEAEKRNVLFGTSFEIGTADSSVPMDMIIKELKNETCRTFLAFVPNGEPHTVRVVQVIMSIDKGISSIDGTESSAVQLGDGIVKDIKFLDEKLLVLWELNGSASLISIAYGNVLQRKLEEYTMIYAPYDAITSFPPPAVFETTDVLKSFSLHEIPTDESFKIERLNVRNKGHKKSRENQRIVLLGNEGTHYKILKHKDGIMKGSENKHVSIS